MKKFNIDISNYEAYAIDYIEGNLVPDEKIAFEEFLNQNPEIKEEVEDMMDFTLPTEDIAYTNKTNLKKSPVEGVSYPEYLIISQLEKVITTEEKKELNNLVKHDALIAKEQRTYLNTKLSPEIIEYAGKVDAKKSPVEGLTYAEYLLISDLENEISSSEKAELNDLLDKRAEFSKEKEFYLKTKLAPETVIFPNKKSLKRTQFVSLKTVTYVITSLAAALVLFIGIKQFMAKPDYSNLRYAQLALKNNFIEDHNIKILPIKNLDIEKEIIIEESNSSYRYDYIPDDRNIVIDDVDSYQNDTNINNYEDLYYAYEESFVYKQIDVRLSTIKTKSPDYSVTNQYYVDGRVDFVNSIKNVETEDVVNYVFKQIKTVTESDKTLRVDIDKKNKCYGIEFNDKAYSICLK